MEVAATNLILQGDGKLKSLTTAGRIGSILAQLIVCARNYDGDGWPTQADYAAYWKITDRTAQREWALFRRAFPGEDGPDRIAQAIVHQQGARRVAENPASVMSLPAPPALTAA